MQTRPMEHDVVYCSTCAEKDKEKGEYDQIHRRRRGGGKGAAAPQVEQKSATFGQFS